MQKIGIPIALDKTEWAAEVIIFLGVLLNGRSFEICIPLEKREKAVFLLKKMLHKTKAMVRDLQSLCGYLNLLGKAVFPRRVFTRCMYTKFG